MAKGPLGTTSSISPSKKLGWTSRKCKKSRWIPQALRQRSRAGKSLRLRATTRIWPTPSPPKAPRFSSQKLHSYNWSIHIVSRDFAEKHPEALKAAYEALVESLLALRKTPVSSPTPTRIRRRRRVGEGRSTFDTPKILLLDASVVADLNKLGQQYLDFGFIKNAPDIADYAVDLSK